MNIPEKQRIIGVTGPRGAGQNTAAEHIASSLGLSGYHDLSDFLYEICAEHGEEPTPDALTDYDNFLAERHGDAYLAERLIPTLETPAVITGIRHLGQVAYLRANTDFMMISVDAPHDVRHQRMQALMQGVSLDVFSKREMDENRAPNTQRLFDVMMWADIKLQNEFSSAEAFKTMLSAEVMPRLEAGTIEKVAS